MRFKIAIAALTIAGGSAAGTAFALDAHDGILSGLYVAKASIPICLTPDLYGRFPFHDGRWMDPFSWESIPNDYQLIGITLPDLLVLDGLVEGMRGERLRDRRILARNVELGSTAVLLGLTILMNIAMGEKHGSELVLVAGIMTLGQGLLALPTAFPFHAENRRESSGHPTEAAAPPGPEYPVLSLRMSF
jgi:hypothetical protein